MPASRPDETSCFALLDDCSASDDAPSSRLYTSHCGTLSCATADEFHAMLEELESALAHGVYAVGVLTYELGRHLHGLAKSAAASETELAHILLFEECRHLSSQQVARWLDEQASDETSISNQAHAGVVRVQPDICEADFAQALARIHGYIESGDTYQVNYTYRIRFDAYGPAASLYAKLRERQPVPYGALIALPNGQTVLSLSPELFVRNAGGLLTAAPMKGTAPATGDAKQDAASASSLAQDPKSRAENVMIVDLLRNDLGRIAALGSVQVPALFEVARHGGVLQMTSTVRAKMSSDLRMGNLFSAIYPCGSITGAPKHRTMQIIDELEQSPRGVYTGAIGWFDPRDPHGPRHSVGDFCLSVPIRTLVLEPPHADGMRQGVMGVGAGIVHDSHAESEYSECQLKARFLTGLAPGFALFETMHATREEGCRHLALHLQRLSASAAYFGFQYDDARIRDLLAGACASLQAGIPHRLRLTLAHGGLATIHTGPLSPSSLPVKLLLATEATAAKDILLRHKTTARERYDSAWHAAEAQGAFDTLFCNTEGELTEGARSNVFLQLQGRWYTPPLSSGLLPGVMRSVLLSDPAWQASERRLTLDDLRNAEQVVACNALRGVLPATILWPEHSLS